MDRILEIKNLVKDYYGRGLLNRRQRAVRAVDHVSFEIDRNTVFDWWGNQAAGKVHSG